MSYKDEVLAKAKADPVIRAYMQNVDMASIRKNLRLTPEERLSQLMELQRFAEELRRAGREAKAKAKP